MTQAVVATTVTGLQGRGIVTTAPNPSQALTWNGSAWAPAGPFLPVAGGTMGGPIVLSGNAAVALNPVSLQQLQAGYLPLTGGSISGSLTVNGQIIPSDSGIKGVTDGSAAPAGAVGEVFSPQQTNIGIASSTWTSFSAINLTPGMWLVFGSIQFNPTTASVTTCYAGLSTVINSGPTFPPTVIGGNITLGLTALTTMPQIMNVTSNTLIYVNGYVQFASGSCTCAAYNNAIRIR